MSQDKFPKMLDYEKLKQQFGDHDQNVLSQDSSENKPYLDHDVIEEDTAFNAEQDLVAKPKSLTGTRLRSYAFAVLTRKEYSKKDLIEKLCLYAQHREEVLTLVEELAQENYQSDQRVAEMTVRSQIRKGKGPNRIKLALQAKSIDKELAKNDMQEVDWYEQAYQLKVKKYGVDVTTDPKLRAKQIRFLQYRGFEMDAIMKAIKKSENED